MSKVTGRILALDLGTKRIGLALSDELGITAQGLDTLMCRNKRTDLAALAQLVVSKQVSLILIGLPLNMNGEDGRAAGWAREYAEGLHRQTGIEVKLWDERLTSAEASRLLRDSGAHVDRKGGALDRMSATILLQSYLDSL